MNKKAFTLIELLIVTLIIGALAAIALPKYYKTVERTNAIESLKILNDIYEAQKVREQRGLSPAVAWDDLGIEIKNKATPFYDTCTNPDNCLRTKKFYYGISSTTATALRGEDVDGITPYYIYLLSKTYSDGAVTCAPYTSEGIPICDFIDSMH